MTPLILSQDELGRAVAVTSAVGLDRLSICLSTGGVTSPAELLVCASHSFLLILSSAYVMCLVELQLRTEVK